MGFTGNRGGLGSRTTNRQVTEGLGGYRRGRLPDRQPAELLQQCVQRAVMAFGQGLEPFHKTMKQLLVPSNGDSSGGDWSESAGSVMASSYCQGSGKDPDADSFEVKFVTKTGGQANDRSRAGRGQESRAESERNRTTGRLRAGRGQYSRVV